MQHITDQEINICAEYNKAKHPESGAIVMFSGDVRNHNKGAQVKYIDYEAYGALANKTIATILDEAKRKWNLQYVQCIHRIGKVGICETAVVVLVSGVHRKEAYDANRYIIDRVKQEAPIWKHEFFEDGTNKWGANCDCATEDHEHHHHH